MEPGNNRQRRLKLFGWIALGCIALAISYTAWVILRGNTQAAQPQGDALPVAGPDELAVLQTGPHLVFLHQAGPHYGQVAVARLDPELSQKMVTALKSDRVYYAAGSGLCLVYDTSNAAQHPMAAIPVWGTLFGPDFKPRHQFTVEGIPSRTRVSPDGKY